MVQPPAPDLDGTVTAGDLDRRGVNFVLADYRTPEFEGNRMVASAEFWTERLARTPDGAWRF